jgi:hypothetical protein
MNASTTDTGPQNSLRATAADRPPRDRRLSRLLAINWLIVLALASAAAHTRVAIPYSPTFLAQVQAGNVSTSSRRTRRSAGR